MKNSIWVGKNAGNDYTFSAKSKMIKNDNGFVVPLIGGEELYTSEYLADFFGLNLKNGEVVELIYDTETGNVEIKREREIGWYLTANGGGHKGATTYHWNGNDWCRNRKCGCFTHEDGTVTVVSEKLPYNEYLRSLE